MAGEFVLRAVSIPLNDARFDLPQCERPTTDYLICSTPRSGSTLLAYLLLGSGMMGVPHEYLHKTVHLPVLARRFQLTSRDGTVDIETYLAALQRRRTTANGVFGLKAHYSQLAAHLERPAIAKFFERARLIRIHRRDLVAQAISYYSADMTGLWSTFDAASVTAPSPGYDAALIKQYLENIVAETAAWDGLFVSKRLKALDVRYEDLLAAPDAVCRSVCGHVGVEPACTFDLTGVPLKRLVHADAEEWKQRFRREHADFLERVLPRAPDGS